MISRTTYRNVFSKALRVWLDPQGVKHIFLEFQACKGQEGGIHFEVEMDQEEVSLLLRKLGAARRAEPVNGEKPRTLSEPSWTHVLKEKDKALETKSLEPLPARRPPIKRKH